MQFYRFYGEIIICINKLYKSTQGHKIVYKRYASLYFCCAVDPDDNELEVLEVIHRNLFDSLLYLSDLLDSRLIRQTMLRYVEILDKYFGSVCELDIIFNFEKAYFVLDEYLLAGNLQETSKKKVCESSIKYV